MLTPALSVSAGHVSIENVLCVLPLAPSLSLIRVHREKAEMVAERERLQHKIVKAATDLTQHIT
jgi:hypothetical protein